MPEHRQPILPEYRPRAKECELLARVITTPDQRRAILDIAAKWHELADQRRDAEMRVQPRVVCQLPIVRRKARP